MIEQPSRGFAGVMVLIAVLSLMIPTVDHHLATSTSVPMDAIWPIGDALVSLHRQALRESGRPGADDVPWLTLRGQFTIRSISARHKGEDLVLRVRIATNPEIPRPPSQTTCLRLHMDEEGRWNAVPLRSTLEYWLP